MKKISSASYINYTIAYKNGGFTPNDYSITSGKGGGGQMITVSHRGGPANDYGVPEFWREHTRNVISADFKYFFHAYKV